VSFMICSKVSIILHSSSVCLQYYEYNRIVFRGNTVMLDIVHMLKQA
jgi:hypothetical protein